MKKIFSFCIALLFSVFLFGKDDKDKSSAKNAEVLPDSVQKYFDKLVEFNKSLNYEHGEVKLEGGIATIKVPTGFKFLGKKQATRIVTEFWGNPESGSILGLILPENTSPLLNDSSYAFVIQYNDSGYIKDNDADKINYNDLLKEMKEADVEENKEREKAGFQTLQLVGWAQKPYYDKTNRVLHWAKEFRVPAADDNTLNYNVRILGRKGVMVLNAVAGMKQLKLVNDNIGNVLNIVQFSEGNKYSDFNPSIDKVAEYGITGLIAGGVLSKLGFFAILAKFAKLIFVAILGAFAAIRRFFTGRKKDAEMGNALEQEISDNTEG